MMFPKEQLRVWAHEKLCLSGRVANQTPPTGKKHPSPVVMEPSRDVGDVGSCSGSRKHPHPRSVPQFPLSVHKISGRASSERCRYLSNRALLGNYCRKVK